MKRLLGLMMLVGSLTNPAYAALEDVEGLRIYKNTSGTSWGKQFLNLFNKSNYNKSYALIIGISEFDHFKTLPKSDPARMRDYLLNEAGFDEVYVLTDKNVTLPSIRQLMEDELPAKIKTNDRFLFYWSGHGATRKDSAKPVGYLPFSHSRPDQYASMLGMQALAQWDELLTAKQTLYLLDACFSGAAGHVPKSDMRNLTLDQIARPSRQMLTAGLANEDTIALRDGSLFTTAVIEGLRGEADAITGNFAKDGIISVGELEQYVKKRVAFERVKAGWNKSITPFLTRLSHHEGDFFFFSANEPTQIEQVTPDPKRNPQAKSAPAPVAQTQPKPEAQRLPFEPEMVSIPAGSFTMGCVPKRDVVEGMDKCFNDELPAHEVQVEAFQIGKYEVTFDEWDACEKANACPHAEDEGWGRGRRPVINVSWDDTQTYLKWLNQQAGKNYRLPTEAEWEYAARGGKVGAYPWGTNQISCDQARYGYTDCKSESTVVGSYSPHGFGLYDTAGNVAEWVQAYFTASYGAEAMPEYRVLRGGSWTDRPRILRSASRSWYFPTRRFGFIGFRISRTD